LANATLAPYLNAGDLVIYESTVYPGASEEICVPILEKISGLNLNENLFLGYSPERINPGDKVHRLTTIKKSPRAQIVQRPNLSISYIALSFLQGLTR